MRHGLGYRKLNKTSEHRKALFKNMLNSLIKYEQITTTLPKAKEQIKALEKIDPAAVKRANTFFPFGPTNSGRGDTKTPKSSSTEKPTKATFISAPTIEVPAVHEETPSAGTSSIDTVEDTAIPSIPNIPPSLRLEQSSLPASDENSIEPPPEPNFWYALGVPLLAGLGLLFVQWRIISGSGS